MNSCLALLGAFALCGCGAGTDAWYLASADRREPADTGSTHILELVRILRPESLPDGFDFRGPAAVSADGRLAALSYTGCRVAVISLASGELERVLGRCGDGPHEIRNAFALAWQGDTLLIVDGPGGRVRWFGLADTVARVLSSGPGAFPGATSIASVAMIDDTAMLLSLYMAPPDVAVDSGGGVLALRDLNTGTTIRRFFTEPPARYSIDPESVRYYRVCAAGSDRIALENNGPGEVLRLDDRGEVAWSRTFDAPGVQITTEPLGRSAAFRWTRLPRPIACSDDAILSFLIPGEGSSSDSVIGRVMAFDWEGRTLLNETVAGPDYPLVFASWIGRDSLFVLLAPQAVEPHAGVYRLRPRHPGETGPFVIPDSVRVLIDR